MPFASSGPPGRLRFLHAARAWPTLPERERRISPRTFMSWDLTDKFDTLDRMIRERSSDAKQMREIFDLIRRTYDATRFLDVAQDNLYAAIARGHRKVLTHLEAGDAAAALHEAAKAVAWFHFRFQGYDPSVMTKYPHIAEELRAVRELVARSEVLREAVKDSRT